MSAALLAHDLVKSYRNRTVLDGVSLTAAPGRRIGLIGENGTGKSTLLRLLAGVEEPDAGHVERPADLGYGHQELPFPADATVADVLDDALREARAAVDAVESGDTSAVDRYLHLEAWDADRRAELVLAGLGLDLDRARPLRTLSGGRRGRLALAALLVRRPSALLLDEPTNHLDDDAAAFLEERLRTLPGAVVVASHDRAFLDAVCTDLVDLDPAVDGPTRYGGGYTDYLATRHAERVRWEQRYAEEQDELKGLRHSVAVTARNVSHDKPRGNEPRLFYGMRGSRVESQVSRRVRNARQRLDELERDQVRRPPRPLTFAATLGRPGSGPAATLRDIHVPGRLTLGRLDIGARDHLLVTGPNGSGKSTLLAVLAGRLATGGTVHRRRGLRVGLLAQDIAIDRPERTARQVYADRVGPGTVPLADLGLIAPRDVDRPVAELSVGQRRRLELAVLVAAAPQLLLLDEPTNHLSPALVEELEAALTSSPGAVVVASHDRWLRRRWEGREVRLRRP